MASALLFFSIMLIKHKYERNDAWHWLRRDYYDEENQRVYWKGVIAVLITATFNFGGIVLMVYAYYYALFAGLNQGVL